MANKVIVSCGVGIDSIAVLAGMHLRGIRPDAIVFSDTGSEKTGTYDYIGVLQAWLGNVGFPGLTILQTKTREGFLYSLEQHSLRTKKLPAFAYGGASCSVKFKGSKIDAHVSRLPLVREAIKGGDKIVRVVGYDDSEADRKRAKKGTRERARLLSDSSLQKVQELLAAGETKKAKTLTKAIKKAREDAEHNIWWYPLQEWGWDRAECSRKILEVGLPLPPKSACYFCPANRPHEIVNNALDNPEQAFRIILIESLAMNSHRTDVGLWRGAIKGTRPGKKGTTVANGATPRPAHMSEYLLDWLFTGKAFDLWMPDLNRKGTQAETLDMSHVGKLYKGGHLQVLQNEPDPVAMVELREKGRLLAVHLRERAEAAGILVDNRFVKFEDPSEVKVRVADMAWAEALRLHSRGVLDPKGVVA